MTSVRSLCEHRAPPSKSNKALQIPPKTVQMSVPAIVPRQRLLSCDIGMRRAVVDACQRHKPTCAVMAREGASGCQSHPAPSTRTRPPSLAPPPPRRCLPSLPPSPQECRDWCSADPYCLAVHWSLSKCFLKHFTEELYLVPTANHLSLLRSALLSAWGQWLSSWVVANSSGYTRSAGSDCLEGGVTVPAGPAAAWCHEYTQMECGLWCDGDGQCRAAQWKGEGVPPGPALCCACGAAKRPGRVVPASGVD